MAIKLNIQTPKRALNKAFLKQRPLSSEIDLFKTELINVLDRVDNNETEEFHKNLVSDFLKKAIYRDNYFINTKGRQDLVIHNGKDNKTQVGVIIEAKRPSNKADWFTAEKPNGKALHELVLYYLRERIEANNIDIKYIVATNIYEWFIIEASYFEKFFFRNKAFIKEYEQWRDWKKVTKDTNLFYNDIAKPFIEKFSDEIPCTYFDIRNYEKALRNVDKVEDKNLIALLKILSPFHLLKVPFADDSNKLDERFYKELLHIIGLEEAKVGSKFIIRRKEEGNRNPASILEKAIEELKTRGLHKITDLNNFGETIEEQLFNISLELCITWINRILFLKLLEGQLVSYHNGDISFRFLNSDSIDNFTVLFNLFHNVLAKTQTERIEAIRKKYSRVPYLNSSLFEISELEDQTITINDIDNSSQLELLNTTILKEHKKKTDKLQTLDYLFKFLDAYDFASEGTEDIQDDVSKTLINASVLGKVFEKINGYKDGSIFTPGFITMYMCRQSIRLAILQKFKEKYGWKVNQFDELKNYLADKKTSKDILNLNKVINSLLLCDPAVGSGHFLVSSLNEIIAIKSELGLLADKDGIVISNYRAEVVDDELKLFHTETEDEFIYSLPIKKSGHTVQYIFGGDRFKTSISISEKQRIQKTLFHEKQTIIENCLFGVDINPNSVKICRLRLWIELLKNAYYKEETNYTELETLPNIDINIKCGNSLISRFSLDANLKQIARNSKWTIFSYQNAVEAYKKCIDRNVKNELEKFIFDIKSNYKKTIQQSDPLLQKYYKLKREFDYLFPENGLFLNEPEEIYGENMKQIEQKKQILKDELLKSEKEIEDNKTFYERHNAFEWRFEFPEVLNDDGDFLGFDVVIGNPPYIKEYEHRQAFDGLRNNECYQGKMDIWYLFGSLGLQLLKPDYYLCFIATNNWVTNAGASNFRNIILQKSKILNLVDFGAYMIFENASIQTMIMLFKNDFLSDNYSFDYRRLQSENGNKKDVNNILNGTKSESTVFLKPIIKKENLLNKPFTFSTGKNSALLEKIKAKQNFILREKADKKLKLKSELGQGIVAPQDFVNKASAEALNDKVKNGEGIFVLSQSELEKKRFLKKEKEDLIKPYYTSDQLHKYYGDASNTHWIIYTKSDINKPNKKTKKIPLNDYPKIKEHLEIFKEVITSDFRPYGLHRAREQHFFEGEKITALRKCPKEPIFTFTNFDCYVSQSFFIIQSGRINLKYLTGLLNSKLIAFWLKNKGKMQGNNYQIDKEPLLEIPIYKPSEPEIKKIADLVDKIISQKQQGKDSAENENKIDELVYKLYELTEKEIKIVEEK